MTPNEILGQERGDVPMGTVARYVRNRNKIIRAELRFNCGEAVPVADLTADVPCRGCTACCRSGLDIDLQPKETGAGLDFEIVGDRRRLRKNADGSCVHLVEGKCSAYAARPVNCRAFDCRDYAVAGLLPNNFPLIADAARRWRPGLKSFEDRDALTQISWVAQNLAIQERFVIEFAAQVAMAVYGAPPEERARRIVTVIEAMRNTEAGPA